MAQKFDYKKVTSKKEFKGALHNYKTAEGTMTVGFTTTMAYVMRDAEGFYEDVDVRYNINQLGLDVEGANETEEIYNVDGSVEPIFSELGFSAEDERDIAAKVQELNELEAFED